MTLNVLFWIFVALLLFVFFLVFSIFSHYTVTKLLIDHLDELVDYIKEFYDEKK